MKNLLRTVKLVSVLSAAVVAATFGHSTEVSARPVPGMVAYGDTDEVKVAAVEAAVQAIENVVTVEAEQATTVAEVVVEEVKEQPSEEVIVGEAVVEEVVEIPEFICAAEEQAVEVIEIVAEQPQVEAAAPSVTYTNVTFKDAYNTYSFGTLEEAKAAVNVPALTDAEANARAIANKGTYAAEAEEVLRLINEYRTANGLGTVAYDDTIATAAMHRAAESAYSDWNMTAYENGVTKRHIRPNFQKASTIKEVYGLEGNFGENFGRYQENAAEIISGWKNSSSHNALLLNGSYTRCGIGVAQDSEGYFYWIALFM